MELGRQGDYLQGIKGKDQLAKEKLSPTTPAITQ
jgi:hypothetical protein